MYIYTRKLKVYIPKHCKVQGSIWLFKNNSWVFLTKITAKLILNVVYHGLGTKKIILDCLKQPQTAFLSFYLTEKTNCIKELCKKSFENILNLIMQNSVYMQKMIISASVKTLHIKLSPSSAGKSFSLRSVSHVK